MNAGFVSQAQNVLVCRNLMEKQLSGEELSATERQILEDNGVVRARLTDHGAILYGNNPRRAYS